MSDIEIKRRLKVSVSFGGFITAMSFLASLCAIYFTYEGQRLDQFYREVAIRPKLVFTTSDENNTWSLRNDGTGPAVVGFFSYIGTRDVLVSNPLVQAYDDKTPRQVARRLEDTLSYSEMIDFVFGRLNKFNPGGHLSVINNNIGSIVQGTQRDIIKIDTKGLRAELNSMKDVLPSSTFMAANSKIDNIMQIILSKYGFVVCYCSITSMYCTGETIGDDHGYSVSNVCPQRGGDHSPFYDRLIEYLKINIFKDSREKSNEEEQRELLNSKIH